MHTRFHAGLTLTELLVVLAIMGAMATAIVPSTHFILSRAQEEDVAGRLRASWQLALATAQAQQRPVVWKLEGHSASSNVTILDADSNLLWTTALAVQHLQASVDGAETD